MSVSADLSGLSSGTEYHFRLVAANANGSSEGSDGTFYVPAKVAIGETGVSDVSAEGARLSAIVNPGGADTTFHFEYGTSVAYGASAPAPDGVLGAGRGGVPVSIQLQGLQPQTLYHMRIAATNTLGTVYGPDNTFTTQVAGGRLTLPDGRQWEMVTPPNKDGAAIEPLLHGVFEAAEDGSGITYLMNGPFGENPAGNPSPFLGTQAISRRGGGVWSTEDIATPRAIDSEEPTRNDEYLSFSSDLSRALVEPGSTLLSPEATEPTLYVRDNSTGNYRPLVTAGNVVPGAKFGNAKGSEELVGLIGTPDLSHVLFASKADLTSNSTNVSPLIAKLYEWAAGRITLVSVLPSGEGVPGELGEKSEVIRHAISNDGSRVFWSYIASSGSAVEALYMTDTTRGVTVKVNAPAAGVAEPPRSSPCYQIASATGSKVFFLEDEPLTAASKLAVTSGRAECEQHGKSPRDLYVYEADTGRLTDLSVNPLGSEPAAVESQVLGASEDGTIVYFVAKGKLAEGAEAGGENLYVTSQAGSTWSPPRLVAVLGGGDAPSWAVKEFFRLGEGPASVVSPDGRFVAFMSARSLTGYNNRDAVSGQPDEEVYLYDETNRRLTCVSCNPTGARPAGVFDEHLKQLISDYQGGLWLGHWLAADIAPSEFTEETGENNLTAYQPRSLTDSGRLFFTSFDSLVSQDTDGTADVYEYEPEGVGSCETANGCVSLISSGTASVESAFLDASRVGAGGEEGEDVFFMTTARLSSRDYDSSYDIYDAHSCSQAAPCASTAAMPPECSSGDACKAAPTPQPSIFGAPASATFAGAGNEQAAPIATNAKHVVTPVRHKAKRKRTSKHGKARRRQRVHSVLRGAGKGKGR